MKEFFKKLFNKKKKDCHVNTIDMNEIYKHCDTDDIRVIELIKEKDCHADEDGWSHNMCAMQSGCYNCPCFRR